ncbi:hypothetical protein AB0B50_06100 [Streptomyces sp. NPDC041068]|uniref:hypothetical protein n=1 Tax=Streptomyces sp. NPDC041068 TaxID=3155130 RepID=UPI0033E29F34
MTDEPRGGLPHPTTEGHALTKALADAPTLKDLHIDPTELTTPTHHTDASVTPTDHAPERR